MKKYTLQTRELEFRLPNGIILIISAWVKSKTKSRRFNSPITSYDETDWHVSLELKVNSKDEFYCNPTLETFSNGDDKEKLRDITNALNCSLETNNQILENIRLLRNRMISEAIEWNRKFAKE